MAWGSMITGAKTFLATEKGKAIATEAGKSFISRFFSRKPDKGEASFASPPSPTREEFEQAFANLQERLLVSGDVRTARLEGRLMRLQTIIIGQTVLLLVAIVGLYF